MYHKLILTFSIACSVLGNIALAQKNKHPNILWVITDEHNFRTLGCYRDLLPQDQALMWGEPVVATPNIDRLAAQGAIFDRMYASSPVCSPNRASMFTGEYPHTVNVATNDRVMDVNYPTIATVLKENGYRTGYAGKWHLSGEAKPGWQPNPNYGFDDNRFMFNRGHWKKLGVEKDGSPYVATKNKNGIPSASLSNADEKSFTTDWLTDRTLAFISSNKDHPFFYVVSLPDPHGPNSVRKPYNTMYANADFKVPESYHFEKSENEPRWRRKDPKVTGEQFLKKIYVQYYGMVKCIDDNMGRIIAKLEEDGILENTIILFSADHGDMMGEHGRINKGSPLEGSAKIPFVVRYPKAIKAGTVVTKATNATDWMETFLSMAGIEDRPKTSGRDLMPIIRNPELKKWDDITFSRFGSWAGAFDSRYKLILDNSKSQPWLLDIETDPDENQNFYGLEAYAEVVGRLGKKLQDYLVTQKDPLLENKNFMDKLLKINEGK